MAYHHQQRNEELAPPPTGSSSFGSLARSASLGARKKDPYAYASDDVESGLGNMDMGDDQGPGAGWGYNRQEPQGRNAQAYNSPMRVDVGMPSPAGARPLPGSAMNPPPIPSHLSRPPQLKTRNDSASPSKLSPVSFGSTQMPNPYVPRGSDPGPSGPSSTKWADYRPPTTQRVPSGSSARSPMTDPLSPYSRDGLSPSSPSMNPYESISPVGLQYDQTRLQSHGSQMPVSPMQSSGWGGYSPVSPNKAPPPNIRSHSHQLFPTSQSANPSLQGQGQRDASMRGSSRSSSMSVKSREGMREVKDTRDLRPVVNAHSNGRRADPLKPGKYLSVRTLTRIQSRSLADKSATEVFDIRSYPDLLFVQSSVSLRDFRQPSSCSYEAEQAGPQ
jgi:hypothetical protein